jgi:hypothetical protein
MSFEKGGIPRYHVILTFMQFNGFDKLSACITDVEFKYKVPIPMRTCRKSRSFWQSVGYGHASSTLPAPARIWFNFKEDLVILQRVLVLQDGSAGGGVAYNLGQCPRHELRCMRRLELWTELHNCRNKLGRPAPEDIHESVQLFGNSEELLIVDRDWYHSDNSNSEGELVLVDMGLEEIWGIFLGEQSVGMD